MIRRQLLKGIAVSGKDGDKKTASEENSRSGKTMIRRQLLKGIAVAERR